MNKKTIKSIFKAKKVQLGDGAIEMIEDYLKREVNDMADRAKVGNFKRITPDTFHFVKGNWGVKSGPRKFTAK